MASLPYPRSQPRGCSCLSCTNKTNAAYCSVGALLARLVHLRQVHPLGGICVNPCHPWEVHSFH